jgi:hypothetical protein
VVSTTIHVGTVLLHDDNELGVTVFPGVYWSYCMATTSWGSPSFPVCIFRMRCTNRKRLKLKLA